MKSTTIITAASFFAHMIAFAVLYNIAPLYVTVPLVIGSSHISGMFLREIQFREDSAAFEQMALRRMHDRIMEREAKTDASHPDH